MTIKTVLLDLDNTLIHNPDRAFALAFLACFNEHMQASLGLADAGTILRRAIKLASTGDHDSDAQSNTDRLVQLLSSASGKPTDDVALTLEAFYASTYPVLEAHIQPIAQASDLIRDLRNTGYAIAIATNPLYAHTAVIQRMQWGNLPIDADYKLITSADNMTYAKPHVGYYQKILDMLAIQPQETAMVGDSIKNDITPAQSLGIAAYHVQQPEDLSAIMNWLEQH